MEQIVFGGGCFWCLEAFFQLLKGVSDVTPGYAGGTTDNPTYEAVCYGEGNHAEVVRITYDPKIITLNTLLEFFWAVHDPTTPNRQGNDSGPQYRSIIVYQNEKEKSQIEVELVAAQKNWKDPIVTEIKYLDSFHLAESYHKNYFLTNPSKAYCQVVINPKLSSIRKKYADLVN